MASAPSKPRRPAPWLRSVEESVPRQVDRRRLTLIEAIVSLTVILAVAVFAVWFLFLASGGPGFGTV